MTPDLPDGWTATEDPKEGPGATIFHVTGPRGETGLAIQFRFDLADHPMMREGIDEVVDFMREPGIPRILPLLHWDRDAALFLYDIGDGQLLSEVLELQIGQGEGAGERVAMELLGLVALILDAAAEAGAFNHGSLSPWRVVLYPDNEVALLGYGLPPIEVSAWLDEETDEPPGPAFRFSPPERIQDDEEDVRADLYALGMMVAELALGRPLLEGTAPQILKRILGEDAAGLLDGLSPPVHELLESLLSREPEDRPASGVEVAQRSSEVLRKHSGQTVGGLAIGSTPEEAPDDEAAPTLVDEEPPTPPPVPQTVPKSRTAPAVLALAKELEDLASELAEDETSAPVTAVDLPAAEVSDDPADDEPTDPGAPPLAQPKFPEPVVLLPSEAEPVVVDAGPTGPSAPKVLLPSDPEPVVEELDEELIDSETVGHAVYGIHDEDAPDEKVSAARAAWPDAPDQLLLEAAKVDLGRQLVLREQGEPLRLSDYQTKVFAYLAMRPGREVTTQELWHSALEGKHGSPESMRGIVSRLRDKIERDPARPDHLLDTEHGHYRFVEGQSYTVGPAPLPEADAPLLGRDTELRDVIEALDNATVVNVVGPPGSGASEVALRAAWSVQAGGTEVHRCVVRGKRGVSNRLGASLGVRTLGRQETEVLAEIGEVLAERTGILVFLDAPRPDPSLRIIVSTFLEHQPRAPLLVASRGALGVEGERVIRMQPLGMREAIALFRRRVSEYRPGAEVPDELASAIVEHLDRLPMALEAAAAQTAFVAPDALLSKLSSGMDLQWAEGGEKAGLEANLAASIEDLEPAERSALEQFVVFQEGFDLSAAEDVVVLPDADRGMFTVLESLVARSLLRRSADSDSLSQRWVMYETVRSYVRRMTDSSVLEAAQRRHAGYYGRLGVELASGPWADRRKRIVLVRECENLEAALKFGGGSAAGAALALTSILGHKKPGALAESVDRLLEDAELRDEAKKGLDDEGLRWWASVRMASARVQLHLGNRKRASKALHDAASELSSSDVMQLVNLAWMHTELGSEFGAESALHRVNPSDSWLVAVRALLRGRWTAHKDRRRAERSLVEALYIFGEEEDELGTAHASRHLADMIARKGQPERAITMLQSAMEVFDQVYDVLTAMQCRIRIAEIHVGLGRLDAALEHLDYVVDAARHNAAHGLLAYARGVLGAMRTIDHDWDEAQKMFFLAMGGAAPEPKRIQALFALNLLLQDDVETAHEEATEALEHPVAVAIVAALERQPPPANQEEAFLLFEALEAWRAAASLARFSEATRDLSSVAIRMVLANPKQRVAAPST